MIERGLINHGGDRHAIRIEMASFKDFKRKDCCFVTTWIKPKGYKGFFPYFRLVVRLGTCVNSREDGIFNDLKWICGTFERLFGPRRGKFEQKFSKIQMLGVLPGGDVDIDLTGT